MENDINERLDFIEFRQDLLFENTNLSRHLYECQVTKQQLDNIFELFHSLREKVENNDKVSSSGYESAIYDIVPQKYGDYHFAESIAKLFHEQGSFEEVFESLYSDSMKFQSYLNSKK